MSRICLVGAGYISRVHADALKAIPDHRITAIVDPNEAAATRLARDIGAGDVFASVEAALAADAFDRAHVLVPPDLHAPVALTLLQAGKAVLLEKPLAAGSAECRALLEAAAASGAALGVNQNFVHHPAFARLRRLLDAGTLGRPNHVSCLYNVPLRQMAARQFGHWMFREPGNILLEQAVHPLSQIVALAGAVQEVRALAGPPVEIAPGLPFTPALDVSLTCRALPAQLRFAVGQSFPFWQVTVICDDGVAVADILANRMFSYRRSRWLEALDGMVSGLATAGGIARDAARGMADYAASTLRLKGRSDPFFVSMRASIAAFHAALDAGAVPALDGHFGADLVTVCETIRDQVMPRPTPRPAKAEAVGPCDVAVLGGTGFIGTHVVRRFVADGLRVAVMARSLRNLPAVFDDPRATLHRGDIGDAEAVARAIGDAPVVVNLAHGGGGGSFEEVRRAMVGGAETVAKVCRDKGVRRLVHVGSIAALYLGPQPAAVTGATPPDPQEHKRGDYARAKVLCDRLLLDLHAREGLPVVILRPGLVVGEGSSPFHSGVGLYNNEQHCIGWNDGRNALPFVLVEDVAAAILQACRAEGIEGRCYNLVGDVRPDARRYVADLAQALGRPLRYHPQSTTWLWLEDFGKWVVKRATGRRVPAPARRDFLSRGMQARFDCADAVRDLGWQPVSDTELFRRRAILVHAP
ncbi:NAD-dependent epimerase/dehydratase family protein [Limobrevibacterium gyesilva]|uniref:NAD-dependent epimerase/dehydratase family protein n=1 Tax=Limobrevibacterium gyesilva TaxID=2991712 RepID=A0AA41YUT8_9PROT|nr:NAD-dependent epimerase/dehydratase family protein [Limobrevibacterium gyesilva]MCW3476890.1 NAD-dependent epimerase/dehydratase family protein [Limobrevibacterium gyesilva]